MTEPNDPTRPRRRRHQDAQMMQLPGQHQRRRPQPPPSQQPTRPQPTPPPDDRTQPPAPPQEPGRRRRSGWRTFRRVLTALVLVVVLALAGIWIYLEFAISRVDALEDYDGRPAAAEGTNWLIVGSDGRDDLSDEDRERLHTGSPEGNRTDTILLAHLPDNSTDPTLVSIPRDLTMDVPGHGPQKINAAYSLGGPKLLTRTVEQATDLRVDHYAEIGFGGFADIVDAVGGVEMDVPEGMVDGSNGVEIPAGKRKLDGPQALSFVRMRKSEATPRSDLDRVANQRQFIGALANEVASPATMLNPFDVFPLVKAVPGALSIDEGDHLHHLLGLGWAMRGMSSGGVVTTTLPTDATASTLDEAKAQELYDALRNDKEIPDSVILD